MRSREEIETEACYVADDPKSRVVERRLMCVDSRMIALQIELLCDIRDLLAEGSVRRAEAMEAVKRPEGQPEAGETDADSNRTRPGYLVTGYDRRNERWSFRFHTFVAALEEYRAGVERGDHCVELTRPENVDVDCRDGLTRDERDQVWEAEGKER